MSRAFRPSLPLPALAALALALALAQQPGAASPARAETAAEEADARADDGKGDETGRAIPRFVSLASRKVNFRTGPGEQYPVTWTFVRQGLPVEVIAEFELWRRIRAPDGTVGWVHKSLLSGRRTALVVGTAPRDLLADPEPGARVVLRAAPGVQGRLKACHGGWCELEVSGEKGWLTRDQIWGVYPNEKLD